MSQQWEAVAAKIQALSKRERLLVLLTLMAVVWKTCDVTMLTSAAKQKDIYTREITEKQTLLTSLTKQEIELGKTVKVNTEGDSKARIAILKQRAMQMDADMQAMGRGLVDPASMPYVLKSILQQNNQLKLLSLKTLPVSKLLDGVASPGAKEAKGAPVTLYKHGFELTLEGNYLDLLRYVTSLEASPWRTLWGNIGINAGTYPNSTMTLTLYTLSLDNKWLSL